MFPVYQMHSNGLGIGMVLSASQEFNLSGPDDSNVSIEHDNPDEARDIKELMISGRGEQYKDIRRDQRLLDPFVSVRPRMESALQRDETDQPAVLELSGNGLLASGAGIDCNPLLISFTHGASDVLLLQIFFA
jgi:hypothetical protein